jgi:hypothetical protein
VISLGLSEIGARVSPRSAALPERKTFNRSILNTRVSTHYITLIKKKISDSEREKKVEPDFARRKSQRQPNACSFFN